MIIKSIGLFAFPDKRNKTIDAIDALALKVERQHAQKKAALLLLYHNCVTR